MTKRQSMESARRAIEASRDRCAGVGPRAQSKRKTTRLAADSTGIEEAARIIRTGGLVAVPTDTLYGLAVDPFNDAAVARLFAVKGRATTRALPLIAAD